MNLLFLDDERFIKDVTWVRYPDGLIHQGNIIVRTPNEFKDTIIELVSHHYPDDLYLSMDHDLGHDLSGYDLVRWLVDYLINQNNSNKVNYFLHSKNPIGVKNMDMYLKSYHKYLGY